MENTTLKLRGMSCASCASSIEDAINSVPGVDECIVNFGAEQATVKYDPRRTDLEAIQEAVDAAMAKLEVFFKICGFCQLTRQRESI